MDFFFKKYKKWQRIWAAAGAGDAGGAVLKPLFLRAVSLYFTGFALWNVDNHGAACAARGSSSPTLFLSRAACARAFLGVQGLPNRDGFTPLDSSYRDPSNPSKSLQSLLLSQIRRPLPWTPDRMVNACQSCKLPFNKADPKRVRKRHCRPCGRC